MKVPSRHVAANSIGFIISDLIHVFVRYFVLYAIFIRIRIWDSDGNERHAEAKSASDSRGRRKASTWDRIPSDISIRIQTRRSSGYGHRTLQGPQRRPSPFPKKQNKGISMFCFSDYTCGCTFHIMLGWGMQSCAAV